MAHLEFQTGGVFVFLFGIALIIFRKFCGRLADRWSRFIGMSRLSYGEAGWALLYLIFGLVFVVIGACNFFRLITFS